MKKPGEPGYTDEFTKRVNARLETITANEVLALLPTSETISHEGGKWLVKSKSGKLLGKHDTEKEAKAQLAAIEISKHSEATPTPCQIKNQLEQMNFLKSSLEQVKFAKDQLAQWTAQEGIQAPLSDDATKMDKEIKALLQSLVGENK